MKANLKNSTIVAMMTLVSAGLTFGLLDRDLLGDDGPDPNVGVWFQDCVEDTPCPGPPPGLCSPGGAPGQLCRLCEFPNTQMKCVWVIANVQCTALAVPEPNDCGARWIGNCLGGPDSECINPTPDGRCKRNWCSSSKII